MRSKWDPIPKKVKIKLPATTIKRPPKVHGLKKDEEGKTLCGVDLSEKNVLFTACAEDISCGNCLSKRDGSNDPLFSFNPHSEGSRLQSVRHRRQV